MLLFMGRRFGFVWLVFLLVSVMFFPAAANSVVVSPERVVGGGLGAGWRLPPVNVGWDYQIGGARPVRAGVGVVVRDRGAVPAGDYAVCYVNGFQTQPDEKSFWNVSSRRGLVLTGRDGRRVVDSVWGEWLLDTRSAAKRERLAAVMGVWVRGCAGKGFDAVEFDNLDSWTRSGGLLSKKGNVAFARLLTGVAHKAGLAVAQKNTVELVGRGPGLGFDFAVVEECGKYDECLPFVRAYEGRVYVVEYDRGSWMKACRAVGARVSVTLRDREVSPGGPYRGC